MSRQSGRKKESNYVRANPDEKKNLLLYKPIRIVISYPKRESDKERIERIHLISPITKQCQLITNASNDQKGREYRSVGGIGKPET